MTLGTDTTRTIHCAPRGLALATVLLLAACGDGEPDPSGRPTPDGPRASAATDTGTGAGMGAGLPDERLAFPLPEVRVTTPAGDTVPLRERYDEVTVINFWATWCVPCLEEIPDLVALEDSIFDRGGRVVGIGLDSGNPEEVRAFARNYEMDYDLAMAGFPWAQHHFDVFGLPVTPVVGRHDTIRHRPVGPHGVEQFLAAARPYLERSGGDGAPGPGSPPTRS